MKRIHSKTLTPLWPARSGRWPLLLALSLPLVMAQTSAWAQAPTPAPLHALEKAGHAPASKEIWSQLEYGHWIVDGQVHAPRTVYVFTDTNCPYCNKFWADARPWVDSGKVQLRHLMVGILTPTSAAKAAALLADNNPAQALDAYERAHVAGTAKAMATGRLRPLDDAGIKPLPTIPAALQAQLDANEKLMTELDLVATPAVVWRDAAGTVQMSTGVPENSLLKILGPR